MAAMELPVLRHHWPDEEPDLDERSLDEWWQAEVSHAGEHCDRCGLKGHAGARCPTVQPYLLKHDDQPVVARVSSGVSGALRATDETRGATNST